MGGRKGEGPGRDKDGRVNEVGVVGASQNVVSSSILLAPSPCVCVRFVSFCIWLVDFFVCVRHIMVASNSIKQKKIKREARDFFMSCLSFEGT